jgi:hypothetical protein
MNYKEFTKDLIMFNFKLFIKYADKYNQGDYHIFLKKIKDHYTEIKIMNIYNSYQEKYNLSSCESSYNRIMNKILFDLNTYNVKYDTFCEFLFKIFHKCISLFNRYNHYRNYSHENLKKQIEIIIKEQMLTSLPINDVLKQNIEKTRLQEPIEFDFEIFETESDNIALLEPVILPKLNKMEQDIFHKGKIDNIIINKLQAKQILIPEVAKKRTKFT